MGLIRYSPKRIYSVFPCTLSFIIFAYILLHLYSMLVLGSLTMFQKYWLFAGYEWVIAGIAEGKGKKKRYVFTLTNKT